MGHDKVETPRRISRELANLAREGLPCLERRTRGASLSPGAEPSSRTKDATASQERPRNGEAGGAPLPSEEGADRKSGTDDSLPRNPRLRQATLSFSVVKPEPAADVPGNARASPDVEAPSAKRRKTQVKKESLPSQAIAAVAAALDDDVEAEGASRALFSSPMVGVKKEEREAVAEEPQKARLEQQERTTVLPPEGNILKPDGDSQSMVVEAIGLSSDAGAPASTSSMPGLSDVAMRSVDNEHAADEAETLEGTDAAGATSLPSLEENHGFAGPDAAVVASAEEGGSAVVNSPESSKETPTTEEAGTAILLSENHEVKDSGTPIATAQQQPTTPFRIPPSLLQYPPELVQLAAEARRLLSQGRGMSAHLRTLMRTGLLAGKRVRFQTKTGRILVRGEVDDRGLILCECAACAGSRHVSPSEFEEHSGSKDRRPADGIFLEEFDVSIKSLLSAINSPELGMALSGGDSLTTPGLGSNPSSTMIKSPDLHGDVCYSCGTGGDLLCCDGCTTAWHLACVGLETVPQGQWYCKFCVADGVPQRAAAAAISGGRRRPLRSVSGPVRYDAAQMSTGSSSVRRKSGTTTGRPRGRPPRTPGPPALALARGLNTDGSSLAIMDGVVASPNGESPLSSVADQLHVPGRVRMAAPLHREFRLTSGLQSASSSARGARNQNKHRRLFDGMTEGGLRQGDPLVYRTAQGEALLRGTAVVSVTGPAGILCECCGNVVSCSQFEAHAGRAQRRQPYENIYTADGIPLKQLALLLPECGVQEDNVDDHGGHNDDEEAVVLEGDGTTGGCVLCHVPDFQRGGFGPKTIMICDQCEREFHVGCLASSGLASLSGLPHGDWFCSAECGALHSRLRARVKRGAVPVRGHPQHTWQVLRGRDGSPGSAWALRAAQELLQESFDPILDAATGADLLPLMLLSRAAGEWDYKGVHTLLLRHRGKPVVAATARFFGPAAAELPLIATRFASRRQGHARVLVNAFTEALAQLGVRRLILPAAHETVETWQRGFGFSKLPEDDLKLCRRQLHILVFPGTEVLWKVIPGTHEPPQHHVLRALPDPALHTISTVLSDIVNCLADDDARETVSDVAKSCLDAALGCLVDPTEPYGDPRPASNEEGAPGTQNDPSSGAQTPSIQLGERRLLRRHKPLMGPSTPVPTEDDPLTPVPALDEGMSLPATFPVKTPINVA